MSIYLKLTYLLCSLSPQSLFQHTLQSGTHLLKVQGTSAAFQAPSPPFSPWLSRVNFICRRVRESHLANTSCCLGSFLFYFILFVFPYLAQRPFMSSTSPVQFTWSAPGTGRFWSILQCSISELTDQQLWISKEWRAVFPVNINCLEGK